MPNSRLEKFIHAICAMDVSDLPSPLSRIEILWNCLITGETPDFEPLSRNEKYLMAMLDRYDINNLPAPMSRGEKLLYKIAVGDTDLTDVPEYLSKYEELLKYLIENGGIGGDDFEYILYTLNQSLSTLYSTAEGPVKSAILKGCTLVNLIKTVNFKITDNGFKNSQYSYAMDASKTYLLQYRVNQMAELSDNSDNGRVLKFEWYSGGSSGSHSNIYNKYVTVGKSETIIIKPFVDEVTRTTFGVWCPNYMDGTLDVDVMIIEYQQNMENWDIPYFTGMQSVKMPVLTTQGKNLWNPNFVVGKKINDNGEVELANGHACLENYISVLPNKTYHISNSFSANGVKIFKYDNEKRLVSTSWAGSLKLTTESNVKYIRCSGILGGGGNTTEEWIKVFQMEEGPTTAYEPYKTNILSTSEDVTLRGIGDVQDTLNCLIGEVTQRIAIFNDWDNADIVKMSNYGTVSRYDLRTNVKPNGEIKTNLFNKGVVSTSDLECVNVHSSSELIQTQVLTSKLNEDTIKGFKEWAKNNNYTLIYELATEDIKTVDLTIQDQDGQPTKLKTYNDITYVSIEAAGLIPTVELEVPTKIEETLLSLGTQMDDISTIQQLLDESADEQTNNMDTIMMATTDIYEEII